MKSKHDIIWLDTVDSTNEEARRRISDIDNLSVLSARSQTSGKGQRGNIWSSAPGENLTLSIILKFASSALETVGNASEILPPLQAYDQFAISEIAALSVVDFLAGHDIEARIKWPNDIYVGKRKICGILIENSLRGEYLASSIVGIGLNVNQRNFDVSLPNPTSMSLCINQQEVSADGAVSPLDIEECIEELTDIFKKYIRRYTRQTGGLLKLRRLYLSQLWRLDEPARFTDQRVSPSGREFTGTIRGLSDVGNLLIETEEGELREFAFKEIGYII